MKNEVPCLSCDRKFASALALKSHTRQKHTNGNGGNGAAIALQPAAALEYFEFQLSAGMMLRVEKQQGRQMLREMLNELLERAERVHV